MRSNIVSKLARPTHHIPLIPPRARIKLPESDASNETPIPNVNSVLSQIIPEVHSINKDRPARRLAQTTPPSKISMKERLSERLGRTRVARNRLSNEGLSESRNDSPVPPEPPKHPLQNDKLIQLAKSHHRKNTSPVTVPSNTKFNGSSNMNQRRQRALARAKRSSSTPQASQHVEEAVDVERNENQPAETGAVMEVKKKEMQTPPKKKTFDFQQGFASPIVTTPAKQERKEDAYQSPAKEEHPVPEEVREDTTVEPNSTEEPKPSAPPVKVHPVVVPPPPLHRSPIRTPEAAPFDEKIPMPFGEKASVATLDMIRRRISQKEGVTASPRARSPTPLSPAPPASSTPERPQSPLSSIASIRARFGGSSRPSPQPASWSVKPTPPRKPPTASPVYTPPRSPVPEATSTFLLKTGSVEEEELAVHAGWPYAPSLQADSGVGSPAPSLDEKPMIETSSSPVVAIKNTPTRLPSPKANKIRSPFLDADRKSPPPRMTPIRSPFLDADRAKSPPRFRPGSPRNRPSRIPSPRAKSPTPVSPRVTAPVSPRGAAAPTSPKATALSSPPSSPKAAGPVSPKTFSSSPKTTLSRRPWKNLSVTTAAKSPTPTVGYLSPTKAFQAKHATRKEETVRPISPMPKNSRLLSPTKSFQAKAEIHVPEKVRVSDMKSMFQSKAKPAVSAGAARAQSWKKDSAQPWKSKVEETPGATKSKVDEPPAVTAAPPVKSWKDSISHVTQNLGVASMAGRFAIQSRHVPATPPLRRMAHRPDSATPNGPEPPTRPGETSTPQRPTWKANIPAAVSDSLREDAPDDEKIFHFRPQLDAKPKPPVPTHEQVSELQDILKRRQTHEEQLLATEMKQDDRTVETLVTREKPVEEKIPVSPTRSPRPRPWQTDLNTLSPESWQRRQRTEAIELDREGPLPELETEMQPVSPTRSPRARPWQKDLNTLSPKSWQRRTSSTFDDSRLTTPRQENITKGASPTEKHVAVDRIEAGRDDNDEDWESKKALQKPSLDSDDGFGFENALSDDVPEFDRARNLHPVVALPLSPENFDPSPTNFSDVFFNDTNPFREKAKATILKGRAPAKRQTEIDEHQQEATELAAPSSPEPKHRVLKGGATGASAVLEFWSSTSKDEMDEALEWHDKDPDMTNMSTPERVPKKSIFTKTAQRVTSVLKRSKSPDAFALDTFKLLDQTTGGDESFDSLWGDSDDEGPLFKVEKHQKNLFERKPVSRKKTSRNKSSSHATFEESFQTDTSAWSVEPSSAVTSDDLMHQYPYVDADDSAAALNESTAAEI